MTASVVVDRRASTLAAQLDAVHRALLDDARQQAAALTVRALRDAEQIEADAASSRDSALEAARSEGVAAAEQDAARRTASAKRAIRARILAAQRGAYDDLREAVRAGVLGLRDDLGYPALLDRWSAIARTQLGDSADITRDPAGVGGVVATLEDRRVAYTLTALAERELDRLAATVGSLWT